MRYGSPLYYIEAFGKAPGFRIIIKQNIKNVYRDKKDIKYDINGIWGVIRDDSGVPALLNVDDRLVHLEYGYKTGESEKSQQIYWDNVLNNDIYIPMYSIKTEEKLKYFDKFKFEVTEIVDVIENVNFLQGDQTIYIVKVKYNEDVSNNKEIYENLLKEFTKKK